MQFINKVVQYWNDLVTAVKRFFGGDDDDHWNGGFKVAVQ